MAPTTFIERLANDERTEQSISLWHKCAACSEFVFRGELERNFYVCAYCGHLFPLSVEKRCQHLLDATDAAFTMGDTAVTLTGTLAGYPVSLFIASSDVIPTRVHFDALLTATDTAVKEGLPLITVVSAKYATDRFSNQRKPIPAAPQELPLGFAATAYVAAEMERLAAVSLPHITVLTETDVGPLTTHFPVGELVIAEHSRIGKRATTLQPALHAPEEQHLAQTSENGPASDISVDCYVSRGELPSVLGKLLKFFQ